MRKSSVYLPDRLKERLAALAAASGRSEANLIRTAIERLVEDGLPDGTGNGNGEPPLRSEDPTSDRGAWTRTDEAVLIGVGVGPGDPALLTRQAVDVLRSADRVFAPSTAPDAIGRAETILRSGVPEVAVERMVFVMAAEGGAREDAIADAGSRLVDCLEAGERVAFVTLGDPNVYSTFSSVAAAVRSRRPGTVVTSVPGIMAFQDLAARSGTVVVDGPESLALVPAHVDDGEVAGALARPDQAVVVYKGGRRLPAVAARLRTERRLDGAVMGELLGLPGQRVAPVADVAERPASYLATVIVPPVRERPTRRRRARPAKQADTRKAKR